MKGFIYVIKNTINNKVYIGQTKVSVEVRWKEHLRHAAYGDQLINRAMKKHGKENFYIETLEECLLEDIDAREIYYIAKFDSTDKSKGYNVSIGGLTPRNERPKLDESAIINMYTEQLIPIHKIAQYVGTSMYFVKLVLSQNNIQIRDRHVSARRVDRVQKELLEEVLKSGKSLRACAKILNMPYSRFRGACKFYNIDYNSPTSVRH